jgi:NAD(P)-dependent dehydrogenase (short-subunit alcohol dehydrogenase family)
VTYRSSEAEASRVVSEIAEMGGEAAALQLDTSNTRTFDEFAAQVTQTALGRVGLPDNIGGAIAALLSEDNRWVNAQRIEVSGGQFI